jgi:integrase
MKELADRRSSRMASNAAHAIIRRDIVTLLDRIVDRGSPIQANRTLATVRRMFNFAIERGILDTSPCVKIRAPGQEQARDRNLSADEIVRLWAVLDAASIQPAMRHGLRFLLATGQRKSEVFELPEREINMAEETWLIPAARAKNGREYLVPLSPLAIEIIKQAKASRDEQAQGRDGASAKQDNGGWLFPSARTGEPYHKQSPDHVMRDLFVARIRNKKRRQVKPPPAPVLADMVPIVPHDLRRTASTKMRELGIAREDVSLVLNHKAHGVTATHYDRYDGLREKRRALGVWGSYLENLMRPAPANVMAIRAAR